MVGDTYLNDIRDILDILYVCIMIYNIIKKSPAKKARDFKAKR